MTKSSTGKPEPLLSYVSLLPLVGAMMTVKDEIDVSDGRVAVK